MQSIVDDQQTVAGIRRGNFMAQQITDDLSWGVGAIMPQTDHQSADDQQALVAVVLESIEAVTDDQAAYSSCTDGRIPVKLLSGDPVPVREQMVGADTVSAFYVAETLGDHFYKDPTAPVADRVREVVEFLKANDLTPSSHVGCGAAGGFVAITENVVTFGADSRYVARQQALLPQGVYDEALHAEMLKGNTARLQADAYAGLSADTFLQAVEAVSGKPAIAELKDDGRGVHGHVEELIVRVHLPGRAINEAKVAASTDGREVFGVNDNRMERIARLFSRGDDQDYRKAYMALEDFADAGHGTLARHLPTYIVTEV